MTELEQVVQDSAELRPRTKAIYLAGVRAFVEHAGERSGAWTQEAVRSWYRSLLRDVTAKTANTHLSGLKYASKRRAMLRGRPDLDFATAVGARRARRPKPRRALTANEARAILAACNGDRPIDARDRAIVTLGLATGMLRSSMTGIQFSDFGRDQTGQPVVRITVKGGQRHTIPLDAEVMDALAPWMRWLRRTGVSSGPVFRSLSRARIDGTIEIGPAITTDGLYRAIRARAKKAGVKEAHPHIFRHTFMAWCQEAGIQPHQITSITGRRSAAGPSDVAPDPSASRVVLERLRS